MTNLEIALILLLIFVLFRDTIASLILNGLFLGSLLYINWRCDWDKNYALRFRLACGIPPRDPVNMDDVN